MTSRLSPVWLVLIGILSVQFGAGIAKSLFDEVPPTVLVWLRLATSAVVLTLVARPLLRRRTRHDWLVVAGLGASLGIMNWAIYQSFARIPLGIAVTIEFIGPLTTGDPRLAPGPRLHLGAARRRGCRCSASRRRPDTAGGPLRAARRGRVGGVHPAERGDRTQMAGLDGLAVASVIATLLLTPLAVRIGGDDLLDGRVLLLGAAVGLLSSVIPYSCEMVALRSLRPAVFGILMSLEPAAAALAASSCSGSSSRRSSGWPWSASWSPASAPPGPAARWPSRSGLNGSVHLDVTRGDDIDAELPYCRGERTLGEDDMYTPTAWLPPPYAGRSCPSSVPGATP